SSGGQSSGDGSSGGGSSSAGLSYPTANPYVTSPYGMRVHPVTGVYKLHDGTDFRARCGTQIRAAAGGRVIWARYRGGYGNQVAIDHGVVGGNALMTSYSHLSRFAAGRGDRISTGQIIGYSGSTGYSTACHLHFMVYDDGVRVNPMSYL
ncbi:MAG TPA: M23 family metallopeptidase, partial [Jiangellaceae bacterium]